MRDFLNSFGKAALSGTSQVVLPDKIDFGPIDSGSPFTSHRLGESHDATAVFCIGADTAETVTAELYHSDAASDAGDGALADPEFLASIAVAAPRQGCFAFIPFPKTHKRYVQAAVSASGAETAEVAAWIEPGPAVR
jgi:hypothetical protein